MVDSRIGPMAQKKKLKRKMRQFGSVFEDKRFDNVLMLGNYAIISYMTRLHIQVFEHEVNCYTPRSDKSRT